MESLTQMSNMKRLLTEYKRLKPNPEISLVPENDCLDTWKATISQLPFPYENASFDLEIKVPNQYPTVPPAVRFITTICHPNIHFRTGEICLDLLNSQWNPTWTLETTILAIRLLLSSPEPSSPLNCDAANLLRIGDYRGYHSLCKMYTRLYAK